MRRFLSLQFEESVSTEVETLYDTISVCVDEIKEAIDENEDVKLFSSFEDVLDVDDALSKLSDLLSILADVRDIL